MFNLSNVEFDGEQNKALPLWSLYFSRGRHIKTNKLIVKVMIICVDKFKAN